MAFKAPLTSADADVNFPVTSAFCDTVKSVPTVALCIVVSVFADKASATANDELALTLPVKVEAPATVRAPFNTDPPVTSTDAKEECP